MTNQDILNVALRQSALELNCSERDLLGDQNRVVISRRSSRARAYLKLPFEMNLVSYGSCIVASVRPGLIETAEEYLSRYSQVACFETPHLLVLNEALRPHGLCLCFMAEYFLPDVNALRALECPFETRLLEPKDFADLYLPEWSNALCEKRRQYDRLCLAAYDQGRIIGMAGVSEDSESMWQIGIDVLPEYRRRGVASALTSGLAVKVLEMGKVPFYCAGWANVRSVRNAVRSGFRTAWVEMTAKTQEFVAPML